MSKKLASLTLSSMFVAFTTVAAFGQAITGPSGTPHDATEPYSGHGRGTVGQSSRDGYLGRRSQDVTTGQGPSRSFNRSRSNRQPRSGIIPRGKGGGSNTE
jgi:hypothetical protein